MSTSSSRTIDSSLLYEILKIAHGSMEHEDDDETIQDLLDFMEEDDNKDLERVTLTLKE